MHIKKWQGIYYVILYWDKKFNAQAVAHAVTSQASSSKLALI